MKRHYLWIDTDSYAGSFERQLCAAATGMAMPSTSSAEVEEIAATYDGPDLSEAVGTEKDKHGRPRHVWCDRTPGLEVCNSLRIVLDRELDPEELTEVTRRVHLHAAKGFQYTGPFQVLAVRTTYEEPTPRDRLF